MLEEDERVRAELLVTEELFNGYDDRMADLHRRHATRLDAIIDQHGWPGRSLVGDDGADAAWIILQHAIGCPALQRKCLPLLQQSVAAGETTASQAAYLEDRINVMEGRLQRYGTQLDWDAAGRLSPLPMEDPEAVDCHRESVGLGPLGEAIERARQRAQAEGERPPSNFEQRQQEIEDWAKSVGWR